MRLDFIATASAGAVLAAGGSAIAVLVLTSIHHAYGALIYDTPWRMHVLLLSVPGALAIAGLLYSGWRLRNAWLAWAGVVVILVLPILTIGVFEGFYNHALKNLVFFTIGPATAARVFAAPVYEMPDNVFFEVTGIMQAVLATGAALMLWRLLRGAGGSIAPAGRALGRPLE